MSIRDRMKAFQDAVARPFTKADVTPKFSVNDFVRDERGQVGVVISILKGSTITGDTTYDYAVRGFKANHPDRSAARGADASSSGRFAWLPEAKLQPHTVTVDAFPLEDLPVPVLGLILGQLSCGDAALASTTNKKMHRAFLEAASWRARSLKVYGKGDIDAAFEAEHCSSWMDFFRRQCSFTIRVVTLFGHRGGQSLSGDFKLVVSPEMVRLSFGSFLLLRVYFRMWRVSSSWSSIIRKTDSGKRFLI